MSPTTYGAIQHLLCAGKQRNDLLDQNRRVIGRIPSAVFRIGHLQKRFI